MGRNGSSILEVVAGLLIIAGSIFVVVLLVRGRVLSDHPVDTATPLVAVMIFVIATGVARLLLKFDLDSRTLADGFIPFLIGWAVVGEALASRSVRREEPNPGRSSFAVRSVLVVWTVCVAALGVRAAVLFERNGAGETIAANDSVLEELSRLEVGESTSGCSVTTTAPKLLWLAGVELLPFEQSSTATSPWCVIVTDESPLFKNGPGGGELLYEGTRVKVFGG